MTTHRAEPRHHHLIVVAWFAVIALLVVLPAFHFAQLTLFKSAPSHSANLAEQITVTGSTPPQDLADRLRAASYNQHYPPIVITYHDIDVSGTAYTVTPAAFASQMRLLHDAGWTTLTAAQFGAWLHGATVPPHSFLLTFDDGALGVYRYADPVLRQYNMHGVAFIITGWVGTHQPYYMTWRDLQVLQADHHWDIEAHTHLGHGFVASNAAGTLKPFLDTTMWLPKLHRVETLAEYSARVRADLQQCIADLVDHGFPRPRLFAYPFSAVGDDTVGATLYNIVHSLFDAAFLDSSAGLPTELKEDLTHQFRRVDVVRSVTLGSFVQNVESSAQRPIYTLSPATWREAHWESTSGARLEFPAQGTVPLSTAFARNEYAEVQLDPHYTSFWTNYQVRATFSGLGDEVSASLDPLLGSDDEIELAVSSWGYRLYQGHPDTRLLKSGELATVAATHQVAMTVRPGEVVIQIDGQVIGNVRTSPASRGGITIGGDPKTGVPVLDRLSVTSLP